MKANPYSLEKANKGVSQQPTAQWAMRKRNETAGAEDGTDRAAHVNDVDVVCTLWQAEVGNRAHAIGAW
eukprot:6214355-Pleurochrysis_carterae.AAC.1